MTGVQTCALPICIACFQRIFNHYEPNNGLSLLEIKELESGGDYEIISQLEDFMFGMVDSCLEQVGSNDTSVESCEKLIKDTQKRIHFPLIEYNIITDKPQDKFSDRVDAMDLNFAPKLRFKHNARRPWSNEEISRIPGIFFQDDYMRELGIDPKTQLISIYRNPYSYEIHNIEFADWEVKGDLSLEPMRSLEETPFMFITTEEAVRSLVADLLHCNVISVNVIQHSYRSYLGYASIIMISSPFAGDRKSVV